MFSSKKKLLSTVAAVPLALGVVVAFNAIETISGQNNLAYASSNGCNPCAAKKACNPCNPCAAKKACNPCNPCAAKKACNPCNPCNPCAAKKACNPCNPCAAKKACNPCNPCAAKKTSNPCNPCAAANPCNPCAAGNPCNPCAASASGGSKKCFIPRLRKAAACNPCAAKKASNPCNPCAASNPCNPCGAAAATPELSDKELAAAYECLYPEMVAGYAKAGIPAAKGYKKWATRFSRVSYESGTHGGRMVNNYSNSIGKKAYAKYEDVKKAPQSSVFFKDSFSVGSNGSLSAGPIFLMEKKQAGFDKKNGDWRYYMIMPNGTLFGTTKGKNSAGMKFCSACHGLVADTDFLYFLPEEFRVSAK